ncbi:hypothetical protein [Allorhizocola rhizosphaerae]|uniref:hypothetical protein n=1 Tax=Allorhizocola rhizosphaerae TaxID=1872709 RepID=UPI001B8C3CEE|nr:hypothetical protein [Allorhizocola rhizosphaerae]
MNTRMLIAAAAACVLLTAGCAGAGDPSVPPSAPTSSAPEGTMTPSPTAFPGSSPTPDKTPAPGKDEVTLTGTVEFVDLEGGCRVLRAEGNKTYEIKGGDPGILKAGARVTVRGKIRTDLMTICQMGPVLEVISSQPA